MIVFICMLSIVLLICFMVLGALRRKYIGRVFFIIYWAGIVIALAVIAYWCDPVPGNDLSRHFIMIDYLREHSYSELITLYHNDNAFLINVGFHALLYVVSLFKSNSWLQFINCIAVYGIWGILIYKCADMGGIYGTNHISNKGMLSGKLYFPEILIMIGFAFANCRYFAVIDGIRNALAFTVAAYAIYLLFFLRHRWTIALGLFFLALSLHLGMTIILVLLLLSIIWKRFYAVRYLLFFWPVCIDFFHLVFSKIPFALADVIAERINMYNSKLLWRADYLFASLLILIYLELILNLIKKRQLMPPETQFIHFFQILLAFTFGCLRSHLLLRMLYMVGALAPIQIHIIYKYLKPREKRVFLTVMTLYIMGLLLYGMAEMRHFHIRGWEGGFIWM